MFQVPLRFSLGLVVTAAPIALLATPASAQTSSERAFDIPALPLDDALRLFMRQSGIQVTYPSSEGAGVRTAAVRGRLASGAALSRLLGGTGLTFRYLTPNSVALTSIPQAADGAIRLGPVQIEGSGTGGVQTDIAARGERTEGSRSYTTRSMATATRLPLSARETPQSVSVITRQQIEDQNLTSLVDVLANTPGISATYADSDRVWFKARGFAITNYQSDGITLDTNSSYSAGEDRYDSALYDRIEVVRGSTGLLTGSGNPSAIINLVRKRADSDHPAATAELAAGSWNDVRGMIDLQSPLALDGKVRGRIVAAYQDRDSWLDFYRNSKLVLYGVVNVDLSPDTLLTVSGDYQHNDPKGTGWGGLPLWYSDGTRSDFSRSTNMGARWTSWETTTKTALATLEHRFDERWNIKATYLHTRNELDARLLWAGGYPDRTTGSGVSFSPARYTGQREQDAADISLVGKFTLFGREHDLNIGYAYREAEGTYYGYANAWSTSYPVSNLFDWNGRIAEPEWGARGDADISRDRQHGVYGVVRLALTDSLKLIGGGRQSRYRNMTDGQRYRQNVFTPYAGLIWDFTGNLSAYVSYTDIFSPQSAQDRGGRLLDPVSGNTLEGGIKGAWFDGRLNAAFAVFDIHQDNVAEADEGYFVPGSTPLQEAYIAVDGVRSRGFEMDVSGEIRPGWNLTASYAHHKTTGDDDGDVWSSSQPGDVVRMSTIARVVDRLSLGGGVNWQSNDWCTCAAPGGTHYANQKAYAVVNATARFDVTERFSAQVNVNNLLDHRYYSQIGFYSRATYGAPRSAIATLRYRY